MTPALIVFAKAPRAGRVKTRLTALLTDAEAAALYEAFLRDTLDALDALAERHEAALRLYYAGTDWSAALTPRRATVHRQRGDGLGARMSRAFEETFADGADAALIVGTDHPTLPPPFVTRSLAALAEDREAVCIGPTEDGGFYLLGMGRFRPALFAGMAYSHAEVFAQTLARTAEATRVPPVVLPEWYDVDRPADLRRLAAELFGKEAAGDGEAGDDTARAPHTRHLLRALLDAHPSLRPTAPALDS